MNDSAFEIYPGGTGYASLLADRRRRPVTGVAPFGLPPSDHDLSHICAQRVEPGSRFTFCTFREGGGGARLLDSMSEEFSGQSELHLLHAYCIAHLRRRKYPPRAVALFHRIWTEFGDFMVDTLPPRWLISAMTTFGDHGVNPRQKMIGHSFSIFFGMLKLCEFERRATAHGTELRTGLSGQEMPLKLGGFSLKKGDLDIHILERLHRLSKLDQTAGLVAQVLLLHLNTDRNNVFARLAKEKDEDFLVLKHPK